MGSKFQSSSSRPLDLKVLALLLSVTCLSACAKKEESTEIGRGGVAMAPAAQWAQLNAISANGKVTASASQQSGFQDAVIGYVEAQAPPAYVGYVSATASGGTSFNFGGKVELQSGVLNTSNTTQVEIRTDSKLLTEIRDEYYDRIDSSGQKVPAWLRGFVSASGYVQGNRAYLKFTDEFGSVTLDGTFSASEFTGTFEYDNVKSYDGVAPTAAGTIGQFKVPTCQFFRCK